MHQEDPRMKSGDSDEVDRQETIVVIHGEEEGGASTASCSGKIRREPSYEFWKDEDELLRKSSGSFELQPPPQPAEDPWSKLISQFVHEQNTSGNFSLDNDIDLEIEELKSEENKPPSPESNMHSVSSTPFQAQKPEDKDDSDADNVDHIEDGEISKCTSNLDFQRTNRSRLADPSEFVIKSGAMSRSDEEEDPFFVDDLPADFKQSKLSVWTILQWLFLILLVGLIVCTLTLPTMKGKDLWGAQLWKWEVMVLVLICGRLVSGWGVRIVVVLFERNFILRKRVLYFVYGLRKAVQNCLWLGLVLIASHFVLDKKVERDTGNGAPEFVTRILVCLLVGALLWLLKTLMIKVLASYFHVSTFFDRIQDALFDQHVIGTLSGRPTVEMQRHKEEEERVLAEVEGLENAGVYVPQELKSAALRRPHSGRVIGSGILPKSPARKSQMFSKEQDEGITIDHLQELNPHNVSAWKMKRLIRMVRHGFLVTLDEQILDSTQTDESATPIRSEQQANIAARKIFRNVAKPNRECIFLEDIKRFMGEAEACRTMSLFEGASESGKIRKTALKNWVVNALRERRALALALDDTKTAINKLHKMVNVVLAIVIFIISLLVLRLATMQFISYLSVLLLPAVFMFGNTCKNVFEAIIFLFVIHPFDVGDRCDIDGVEMIVEEMNILTTVFLRGDNNQKVVFHNSNLATRSIGNSYRSPNMGDSVEFFVHISTPSEKIGIIRQRIISYMESKKDLWAPSPMVIVKDLEGLQQLKMAVWMIHKINHQNMDERWRRRCLLVEEIVKILKEVDIEYRMIPLDINVKTMPMPSPVTSTRLPHSWTSPGAFQ